jgi:hypothetical protein
MIYFVISICYSCYSRNYIMTNILSFLCLTHVLILQLHRSNTKFTIPEPPTPSIASIHPYQKPLRPYVRPPLIPRGNGTAKQKIEEGFFTSVGKLIEGAKSYMTGILGSPFSKKKHSSNQYHHQQRRANHWPVQESYGIPHDETPPPLDTRAPTPQKDYGFVTKEPEKIHRVCHGQPYFNGWDGRHPLQQPEQQMYRYQQPM